MRMYLGDDVNFGAVKEHENDDSENSIDAVALSVRDIRM